MTAWTRPTILRPDLCRWVRHGNEWEFGPDGCELVFTIDDSIVDDVQARDASMRLVESHVALHPTEDRRIWLGMRFNDEWLQHPSAQATPPSARWKSVVHRSSICKHHEGESPERKIHDETWLIHHAARAVAEHLPVPQEAVAALARFDETRNLHIVNLPVEPLAKRRLEQSVAFRLGHDRVRIP